MLLDDIAADLRGHDGILAAGLRGFAEIALGLIMGKFTVYRHHIA
jgi:hypothetical protein